MSISVSRIYPPGNVPKQHKHLFSRLVDVQVPYYSGSSEKLGVLTTFDSIADSVLGIFFKLHEHKFNIHSIFPMHEYGYDDNASMEQNNTSCFNYRHIEGSDKLSLHSFGMAIDINPVDNPYITEDGRVIPAGSVSDRSRIKNGMVEFLVSDNKSVVDIFSEHGFNIWGGNWRQVKDYHHFQFERGVAERLISSDYKSGSVLWAEHLAKLC